MSLIELALWSAAVLAVVGLGASILDDMKTVEEEERNWDDVRLRDVTRDGLD